MVAELLDKSLPIFFGVFQSLILLLITSAFKMYWDVRELKKDLNQAFKKIRDLELSDQRNKTIVETSARCSGTGERS